ncbi:unnamed protein product [Ectocarpus sp. CCAP 1310/34]|nr:unnamed protein product [Ectocarpus sp. CCAP 1310/34]
MPAVPFLCSLSGLPCNTAVAAQPIIKQTVKELVDNAIDSCRCRASEQDAPTVRVVLRRSAAGATVAEGVVEDLDLDEEPLELQVADNGAGLTDVTKAVGLFSSTKSGHTPPVAPGVSPKPTSLR